VIFTPRQWFAICAHMMNENPANFFLMPFQDKEGKAKFAKAYGADAEKRMAWAWDTITGKAKTPASIGFYPTNAQNKSRWAAMDFDIHDDDRMRARDLAHCAFAHLIREPQLYVALTTSAGDPECSGWHLFAFTHEFFPCDQWTRLLKQVADRIGAPIQPGICEIFPDDCKGIGHGIRAPGTWNPKTGDCGLILHESLSKLLPASFPKEKKTALRTRATTGEGFASCPSREFYRGEQGQWKPEFSITAPRSRHEKLTKLVGTIFFQVGREVARQNVELQYAEANPAPATSLDEHLEEFEELWTGLERKWLASLSNRERQKYDALKTETSRDAFRIVRNWSRAEPGVFDFKIVARNLGDRLGVSPYWASNIRREFCSLGVLHKTADYVPHKLAARYQWIANEPNQ
jgi:hypothetical protein